MRYFTYKNMRPPRINVRALLFTIIISMIFRKPAYVGLIILDHTSTIKAVTDDTNTVNVECSINKELHIINIWLKLHAL